MRLLALDTSGPTLSAALGEAGGRICSRSVEAPRRVNEELAPLVEALLREAGWMASSLQLVAVNLGPGSYTGLRAGLAFAKGLCLSTGARLLGVSACGAEAVAAAALDRLARGEADDAAALEPRYGS